MKTSYAAILAITLSSLASGYASAEYAIPDNNASTIASAPSKTRAQVRAELVEAQRTGDVYADGNSGKKLNELRPDLYQTKAAVQGKTREQVKAELVQAQRSGEFQLNQIHG
jgi:hypothetical protein